MHQMHQLSGSWEPQQLQIRGLGLRVQSCPVGFPIFHLLFYVYKSIESRQSLIVQNCPPFPLLGEREGKKREKHGRGVGVRAQLAGLAIDTDGAVATLAVDVDGYDVPFGLTIGLPEALAILHSSMPDTRRPGTVGTWANTLEVATHWDCALFCYLLFVHLVHFLAFGTLIDSTQISTTSFGCDRTSTKVVHVCPM